MKNWFSADYHFGHGIIIKYCNRPFRTVREMNEAIIKNHNLRVKNEDTVFFVGDFCFRNSPGGKKGEGAIHKAEHYIKKLNGRFVFIKGNHDKNNSLKTPIERLVIKYGGKRICLVHNPIHADSNYELNLVGHIHEKWLIRPLGENSLMYNVGVDLHKFRPISFEEINKEISKWKRENPNVKTETNAGKV